MSSSFIENVNKVAKYLELLLELNLKLPEDVIRSLVELSKLDLMSLKEDVDKGTFFGQRQIKFNFVENCKDYSESMSVDEARELFFTENNQIRYSGLTLVDIYNTSKYYEFSRLGLYNVITTPIELYYQLEQIITTDSFLNNTSVNSIVDPITDNITILSSTVIDYSNLQRVILHVDETMSIVNYKEANKIYSWADHTSSLIVLSNHLGMLIKIYDNLDSLLKSEATLEEITNVMNSIELKLQEIMNLSSDLEAKLSKANDTLERFKTLTVAETVTGIPQNPAEVTYDYDTNSLSFLIPKGDRGESMVPNEVDIFANRVLHDDKPRGFLFLASDQGLLYAKNSDEHGDWGVPISFGKGDKGDKGDQGIRGPAGSIDNLVYATTEEAGVVELSTVSEATTNVGLDLDKKVVSVNTLHLGVGEIIGSMGDYKINLQNISGRDTLLFVRR